MGYRTLQGPEALLLVSLLLGYLGVAISIGVIAFAGWLDHIGGTRLPAARARHREPGGVGSA